MKDKKGRRGGTNRNTGRSRSSDSADLPATSRREGLILRYQRYVQEVANRLVRSMGLPRTAFKELVSAGNLGLVEAASRYDARTNTRFEGWAYLRIRGAMIDSIRRGSYISGRRYRRLKAFRAAHDLREHQWIVEQSDPKSEKRGPSDDWLTRILRLGNESLFAFQLSASEMEGALVGSGEDPESNLSRRETFKKFASLVETLPAKERLIVREYYFNEKSFAEIVNEYTGFSKSWVSRLHARALRLLAEKYHAQLAEESPSDIPRGPRTAR